MAASFNALPVELVKRIVDMVHEQDAATRSISFERALLIKPKRPDDLGEDEDNSADKDRKRFRTNVPTRVTAEQIDTNFFRFEVLGEAVEQHIRHVDADLSEGLYSLVTLACALRKLPNLSSLTVNHDALEFAYHHQHASTSEDVSLYARSLKQNLARVTSLDVAAADPALLAAALGNVDASRLRRLAIKFSLSTFAPPDGRVFQAVNSLGALQDLSLTELPSGSIETLKLRLWLPSLRTLELVTRASYEGALRFANTVAPSLSALTIRPAFKSIPSDPSIILPTTLLPHLRKLAIVSTSTYLPAFHSVHPPTLEHLSVELSGYVKTFPVETSSAAFPPSLRTFTISFSSLKPLKTPAALSAACVTCGIHLAIDRKICSASDMARRIVRERGALMPVASKTTAQALEETLEWAKRRARALVEAGDGVGLHELAQATVRLRERHLSDLA
ncbi:hypothetical protein JCM10450v2_005095 [Rhodotorula kratochvilovae]